MSFKPADDEERAASRVVRVSLVSPSGRLTTDSFIFMENNKIRSISKQKLANNIQ